MAGKSVNLLERHFIFPCVLHAKSSYRSSSSRRNLASASGAKPGASGKDIDDTAPKNSAAAFPVPFAPITVPPAPNQALQLVSKSSYQQ
jgi:hypothetical protein